MRSLEDDKKRPEIKSRELGYWLGRDFWNKGFMTEAAKAAIDYDLIKWNLISSRLYSSGKQEIAKGHRQTGISYEAH
jgi:hypothetical protein